MQEVLWPLCGVQRGSKEMFWGSFGDRALCDEHCACLLATLGNFIFLRDVAADALHVALGPFFYADFLAAFCQYRRHLWHLMRVHVMFAAEDSVMHAQFIKMVRKHLRKITERMLV